MKRTRLHEARTDRHNLPVRQPALRHLIADLLFSPPKHLHHYRDLSRRMVEHTVDNLDCGGHCT